MFGLSSGSGIGSESGLNPTIVRDIGLHTLYIHIYAWLHPAAPGSESGCAWLPGTQVEQLFVLIPRGTQQPRGKKISSLAAAWQHLNNPNNCLCYSLAAARFPGSRLLCPAARLRFNKSNNCSCSS